MKEFRRLAAKIDLQMLQLSIEGIHDAPTIMNRMMGYMPEMHKIWVGTTDDQLIALTDEFSGFYRYAIIIEEGFEAERNKPARPYDGIKPFSEQHAQLGSQLLTTAAELERGYQALIGCAELPAFQPQVTKMNKLHQKWLSDVEHFKTSLRAHGAEPKVLEYMNETFGRLAAHIKSLAG